jgi:hypothetical protein
VFAAQAPRWRTVTTFTGARSVPFQIDGTHWRIIYSLQFRDICSFLFINTCSGPTARAVALPSGRTVATVGMASGSGQAKTIGVGAGVYQVQIAAGGDPASYRVVVQDYY